MITFKNRFAEFDNLDDSHNENSLRNCYFREYRRNNLRFNLPKGKKGNGRYNIENYNDIRLKNFPINNNNLLNSQRQKNSITPFPRIPLNNRNNNNNLNQFNSVQNDMNYNQRQNNNLIRSTPNYPILRNNNVSTPNPFYNDVNNNSFNNNSFENSFNNSNDNIQNFNENDNMFNNVNNNYDYDYNNNMDNSLNMSNEYQLENSRIENEIKKEKQKQILLEQQRLNQIEKELREIRLKRNLELKRKLEQKKNEELMQHQNRLKRIRKVNNSYRINNRNRNNKSIKQSLLQEAFKMNLINDRLYMNQLIDEINKIKLYQNEANNNFRQNLEDLYAQNEIINNYNKDLMSKIKEVKYAVKEREDNPDTINDYLIEQKYKGNNRYQNYFNNTKKLRNNYRYNNVIDDNKYNNYDDLENINYNYKNYFLGKKDKDIEEFNLLNQNLVNDNNGTVVSPLIYDKNKNNRSMKLKSYTKNDNENNKDDIYALIRKNNDRLDRIKEIEDRMNYENS